MKLEKRKIQEYSLRELVEKFGILMNIYDYENLFLPSKSTHELVGAFTDDFRACFNTEVKDISEAYEKLLNVMDKYESLINKDGYVFHCYNRAMQGDITEVDGLIYYGAIATGLLEPPLIKNEKYNENVQKDIRDALIASEVDMVAPENIEVTNQGVTLKSFQDEIFGSKYATGKSNSTYAKLKRRDRKSKEKLQQIEDMIGLDEFVDNWIFPVDFLQFIRYRELSLKTINYFLRRRSKRC